ncbi:MAG TPA: hypothetical protein HA282_04895 [Nanoarchaeota archaeon]|nr:MAG: hypothetical protein QT01_C0009G0019 [archaeon GW2011_AR6]MBS3082888.1 hypothetical protein [Candidatus Pacearchaeota archaeon]HIH17612.1 hypothetical protein [Nanoarchaeota archaeon]HIH34604.1 hypothetical protein [Nanoarchaeota archaeon]HIH51402.1 hypothetical protein [Nanoarchaeota archaeon]
MTDEKIDKVKLLEIISRIKEISKEKDVTLYALGGTALTLLDLKGESKDIDFIINKEDWVLISEVLTNISDEYSVRIDRFFNGWMVGYWLPDDFREKAIKLIMENNLKIESPALMDLLITKLIANRVADRRDIESILENYTGLSQNETLDRLSEYTFNKPQEGREKKQFIQNFIIEYFAKRDENR